MNNKKRKRYVEEVMQVGKWLEARHKEPDWRIEPLTFTEDDIKQIVTPQCDALVTSLYIRTYLIDKVFIDTGSSPNIL